MGATHSSRGGPWVAVAVIAALVALTSFSPSSGAVRGPASSFGPAGFGVSVTGPSVARNATDLISDGSFTTNPGPWTYTNGTTGIVTGSADPPRGARLGGTSPSLLFDSMDDIFGPNPWAPVTSGSRASSTLAQVASPNADGAGAMQDNVTFSKANAWAGASRNTTGTWNWSRYDRLGIWMDLASPGTFNAHVVVAAQSGKSLVWVASLSNGWNRYPVQLNASSTDLGTIDSVQIQFYGATGTTATIYVDDIVLLNSTPFAEAAGVTQTFTKGLATGSSVGSLVLHFRVTALPAENVASTLAVKFGTTVEWSETPVTAGNVLLTLDLSADPVLEGTGTFTLSFSLELDRTSWQEASQTTWIDNVSLIIPGTLAQVVLSPTHVSVPLNQTTVFSATGEDPQGNPVPLNSLNWTATIGQIVPLNGTSAKFVAPAIAGFGSVSATEGSIVGIANVTVGVPVVAVPVPVAVSVWRAVLWPGSALIAITLAAVGGEAFRRSRKDPFRVEEVLLVTRDGRLITDAGSEPAARGDRDVLAGMLTAVMTFAQDSFMTVAKDPAQAEREGLNRFDVGGKQVALERGRDVYVAAIGTGRIRSRDSRRLREFLADVENRYGDRLYHWSGMIEDLPGVGAMVGTLAAGGRYRKGDWLRSTAQGGSALFRGTPRVGTSPQGDHASKSSGDDRTSPPGP